MAKLTEQDRELRLRLCAHLRRLFAEHQFTQRQQMAKRLDIDPGHFSALYNFQTEIGLDVAVKLHRTFRESLNHLCDDDAPAEFYPSAYPPGAFDSNEPSPLRAQERAPPPQAASPERAAQPEKRPRRRAAGRKR